MIPGDHVFTAYAITYDVMFSSGCGEGGTHPLRSQPYTWQNGGCILKLLKGEIKMKRALGILLATLAIAAIAWGADNTLGTWKYNTAKSKQASGMPPITSFTVTYEAADGGVKITGKGERADGSKIEVATMVQYDGKEVAVTDTGLPYDTVAYKQVNANTLIADRSKRGGKYRSTVRLVVSADGKMLTQTAKGTGADGKPFTTVAVFDRQ